MCKLIYFTESQSNHSIKWCAAEAIGHATVQAAPRRVLSSGAQQAAAQEASATAEFLRKTKAGLWLLRRRTELRNSRRLCQQCQGLH